MQAAAAAGGLVRAGKRRGATPVQQGSPEGSQPCGQSPARQRAEGFSAVDSILARGGDAHFLSLDLEYSHGPTRAVDDQHAAPAVDRQVEQG